MRQIDIEQYINYAPSLVPVLERVNALQNASPIRIAVCGKYNHGKSSLLNTFVGKDIFSVADKRETVQIQEHEHDDVIWIDTPGLDADVDGLDDRIAKKGALEDADAVFLVHRADAGELDKYELDFYRNWVEQESGSTSKLFLVLSAVDQVSTQHELDAVTGAVKEQLPDIQMFPVSSVRYQKGITGGKKQFIERSGMKPLFTRVSKLKKNVFSLRKKETKRLLTSVCAELIDEISRKKSELESNRSDLKNQRSRYVRRVERFLESM